jgi:hypothetical protein
MRAYVSSVVLASKGGKPARNSNMSTPSDHVSTEAVARGKRGHVRRNIGVFEWDLITLDTNEKE